MTHVIPGPCPATPLTADVAFPALPASVAAAVELRCLTCGYKMRLTSPRRGGRPGDFDTIVGDFLGRHAAGGCRHDG